MKIQGYRRENGKVGIRNHVAILPSSVCASETAVRISNLVPGTVALPHQHGCCQVGMDSEQTINTLIGLGANPNVAKVLVVGLGCEGAEPLKIAEEIRKTGKEVSMITIQGCGGTLKTIEQGARIAREMIVKVATLKREDIDISELTLAIECGGTDTTSGLCANPAVGTASDILLSHGGIAMLSETTELIGAEHILANRAVSKEVKDKLLEIVKRTEDRAMSLGVDIRGAQPTPGNIEGGIITIEEKSLGCIYKAGSAPIQGVLEYAEIPSSGKGFYVMDTPGQDIESITGMVAGGAQLVIFTTGRGTPTGFPIAPVIKITGNETTYNNMIDNIDINAGKVITEGVSIKSVGEEIFSEMLEVSNGKPTKAESLGHKEFGIYKIAPTF